jgi:hypothetical protein
MRVLWCAWLCLISPPALADGLPPPVGAILVPKAPAVIYNRPPNAVFGAPAEPIGVAREADGATELFGVVPSPAAPSGFAVQAMPPLSVEGLHVQGAVDVYVGNELQTWVEVTPGGTDPGALGAPVTGWLRLDGNVVQQQP